MRDDILTEITPDAYVRMFENGQPPAGRIAGVCGRVIRGRRPEDFTRLSFMPGRRLAWVLGPEGMQALVGLRGTEIVLGGIGKVDRSWLDEKLAEEMRWKLAVFSQARCGRADWNGLFAMIDEHFPADIAAKLLRWDSEVREGSLALSIDAGFVTGAVKDNPAHPLHMSEERYRLCEDTATNARLFLWHSLGVNQHFVGDGMMVSPDGSGRRLTEYLSANVALADLPGCRLTDLSVD